MGEEAATPGPPVDPREPTDRLLRDLRTRHSGLAQREAERRLVIYGANVLRQAAKRRWVRDLLRQFTHPLALLLWVAAGLATLTNTPLLAGAIAGVVLVNALFAFCPGATGRAGHRGAHLLPARPGHRAT